MSKHNYETQLNLYQSIEPGMENIMIFSTISKISDILDCFWYFWYISNIYFLLLKIWYKYNKIAIIILLQMQITNAVTFSIL